MYYILQVFDACIVLASFTVDFVFVNGMAADDIQDFVFILAFMLPWGVIRVVNSKYFDHVSYLVTDCYQYSVSEIYTNLQRLQWRNVVSTTWPRSALSIKEIKISQNTSSSVIQRTEDTKSNDRNF